MNYWEVFLLGLVEGLTEFLPVSSTYHLIFAGRLLEIPSNDFTKLFNVFIQSGAILAVLVMYWGNLKRDLALVKKILVAFIPTALLGVLAYRTIKNIFFEASFLMTGIFILVGVLFLGFELLGRKGVLRPIRPLSDLGYKNAVIIGLVQAFAFLPGVSRAAAVILAMMLLGFRRDDSARFSFLLAIPTILAAGAYDIFQTRETLLASWNNIGLLLAGFVVSFIVAYFAVKWFIRYLQKHTFNLFGFYRLIAGAALLLFLLL